MSRGKRTAVKIWRVRFRDFCEPHRFVRMVCAFVNHRRFKGEAYGPWQPNGWQEKLWDTFTRENADVPFTLEALTDVLNVCLLHDRELKRDTVPILYGLITEPEGLFEAREALFPLANNVYLGGCTVEEEKTHHVYYCAACREAERQWFDENLGRQMPDIFPEFFENISPPRSSS